MTHPMIEKLAEAFDRARHDWAVENRAEFASDAPAEVGIIAVLRALREPDEGMLNGARDWSHAKYGKPIGSDAAQGCLRSMIDSILTEEKEQP